MGIAKISDASASVPTLEDVHSSLPRDFNLVEIPNPEDNSEYSLASPFSPSSSMSDVSESLRGRSLSPPEMEKKIPNQLDRQ